jgi:hypothetical protein
VTQRSPFRDFKTSPEIIRLAVMLYIRYPLSLRRVEDLLYERGLDTVSPDQPKTLCCTTNSTSCVNTASWNASLRQ